MSAAIEVKLNKFKPRSYQIPVMDAILNKGYRRAILVHPRRAGKDILCWNIAIRYLLENPCICYYLFPEYSQCRKALWDSMTIDGERFLDYIPPELIENRNNQEMKIRFINGSLLQMCGSDNYNSLMGTNPKICIFSEFALQDPMAWNYIRPILAANDGIAIFISTPRGFNHLYQMFEMAKNDDNWFVQFLTTSDTNHISEDALEEERKTMAEDLFLQEFYCSFSRGIEGSIYAKALNNLRLKGQISQVPFEPGKRVHTAWDIGRDTTAVIFFQTIGQTVRLIDYYEKANENLEHFVGILQERTQRDGYIYDKHFFPHDLRVTEWAGPKFTRIEKARQLGIKATIVDDVSLEDGIEYTQSSLPKLWIDEAKCQRLIKCLENYRFEYDSKKQIYKRVPLHNWASHGADALRYLCLSLPKTRDGTSPAELDRRYEETIRGNNVNMPKIFQDDIPDHR